MTSSNWPFPWPEEHIAHYTALRTPRPLVIDGNLDKPEWQNAVRSPRFGDLINGKPTVHDTRAAVLWDDQYLYVGFWVEEPFVEAKLTEQDSLIYNENDVELFIAGKDAYFEFEINALGTIYEALFVFDDAYESGGYAEDPELAKTVDGYRPWNGVGYTTHPRGPRHGFFKWDLPGLKTAVRVDGTLNDNSDRDRGWTAEIALPWSGMQVLAQGDGRALPPNDGDTWRMDFSRFNTYRGAPPSDDPGGWAWSPHGVWDSHIPEVFPFIHFSRAEVGSGNKGQV